MPPGITLDRDPGQIQDLLERLYLPVGLGTSAGPSGAAGVSGWIVWADLHSLLPPGPPPRNMERK